MRLNTDKKLFIVKTVIGHKKSVTELSKEYKIARKTIHFWVNKYNAAPSRNKKDILKNQYSKGIHHPRYKRGFLQEKLIREVKKNPGVGVRVIAKAVNAGNHIVYNTLKALNLTTQDSRIGFSKIYAYPGILANDIKLSIVKSIVNKEKTISSISAEYCVARKTIYKWISEYKLKGNIGVNYACGLNHPKAFNEAQVQVILDQVIKTPALSIHKLSEVLNISSHGLFNVLKRHNLTHSVDRIVYAQARISQTPQVEESFGVPGRVKSVFESFIPNLAPAPPPASHSILKTFVTSFISTSVLASGIVIWWSLVFSQAANVGQFIGLVFATIALFTGSVFFLYSLKYYLSLGIVLSYSNKDDGDVHSKKITFKNLLSKILGIETGVDPIKSKSFGLTPNLDGVLLKGKPFVSVQIPFYNEKNVVRRAIEAAVNFKYPNYEIILADDSTDETTSIIREYQESCLFKYETLKETKGDGWTLTSVEVKPGVILKHLHRTTRDGYKGKALELALKLSDPRTQYVSIFDADFVPYPDTLELFLKYFQVSSQDSGTSNIAAVQGYQWHVLNKSENWITRGVRSEYAGSYVIERSGAEIYGGLKQISGSVYMIKKAPLAEVGWGTSITEDFELTLRLYEKGYKVLYTPYIQAPSECVSTLKRLVKQRMRWAEGHSFNVKKMFGRLMTSPNLTIQEKLEFLYLSPYYLQALFFIIGTMAWLVSETIFKVRIPFWTAVWGWSLVITNIVALPLLNAVGLFVEESGRKDYIGLGSFITLSYLLVPFQAYAAVKGFMEKEEGPWFRTPKTGRITDVLSKGRFFRFITGMLPGEQTSLNDSPYLAMSTAGNSFDSFKISKKKARWVGKAFLAILLIISNLALTLAPSVPYFIKPQVAQAASFDIINKDAANEQNNLSNGAIAINTNKNIYLSGDNVSFGMGVVDAHGATICSAKLELVVTGPDGKEVTYSVSNSSIKKSGNCQTGNNVTSDPDYYLNYQPKALGKYTFKLTDKDNNLSRSGEFSVTDNQQISIERSGATRINPVKANYTMSITVTADQDFKGQISDSVPEGFKIIDTEGRTISWGVDLKKGETNTFEYTYQAPAKSPEFYELGPLTTEGYKESRLWQLVADAPPAYHMATGRYVGSGNYKQVSGLGFAPEAVIIKATTTAGVGAFLKTSAMADNTTAYLGSATADDTTGLITLDTDGFTVQGTNANSANVSWTWAAWGGSDCSSSGQFCIGEYLGDGSVPRTIATGFQPDIAIVKRSTAVAANFQTVGMTANYGQYFMATAQDTTGALFGTIQTTGFQVGSTNDVTSGVYYFVAFKKVTGNVNVGSYTGNGTSQSVTSMGFSPDFVITKNTTAVTPVSGVFNGSDSYGDSSFFFTDTANVVGAITSLDSDGFSVGSNSTVNGSGDTIFWMSFLGHATPTSSGTFKMASGTYTGNGNYQNFNGLGFAPDLVIIKGDTAQAGVFRTTQHNGDATSYLDSATADFAGGITSLNPDGFAIGTSATVNSSSVNYYWEAFGNAWRPATNSGASDFVVGTYYGNGIDSRNITGLPFQPDLVVIKRSGASSAVFRTSQNSGDQTAAFAATAEAANKIQAFNSDGFQIGTDATVNTAANFYRYFAFKTGSNFAVGTYSGTGSSQNITSVGFQPDDIWIKSTGATRGVQRTSDMGSSAAIPFINVANVANAVSGILSNGFTVVSAAETNTSGTNNYRYVAWKKTNTVSTPTYKFATGRYVGSGNYKQVSGLGFAPEAVIIKASTTGGVGAMLKTSSMIDNSTAYMGSATADDTTGLITLDTDGFTVTGTNANIANTTWAWAAWGGSDCSSSGQFCVGDYLGDGSVPRTIATGFQPDISIVKRSTNAVAATFQTVGMTANNGDYFMATAQDTTGVLFGTIQTTGFQVGSTNDVSAGIYHFVAVKKGATSVNVGSYTGNGTSQSVTSMGFSPEFVITKNTTAATPVSGVFNGSDSYGDSSFLFTDTANSVGSITSLDSDGFSVGSNSAANGNGDTVFWMAFSESSTTVNSSGTFKMASGTYTGNGNYQNFNGLGFAPDLVIIKGDTAQAGVFRTTQHNGDATSYLDSATADFAGGITSLNPDGFAIGTAAQVNTNGTSYYWTAYGNAWRPATNSGASDFVIGTYYGNGIDSRNITGLPFQPDLVVIKRSGASSAVFRTSQNSGDQTAAFAATAEAANKIQAFNSDGFQIGTDATVNTAANFYRYFAFKAGPAFAVGTYSGNGTSQNITSVGFQPNNIWIKSTGATRGVQRTSDMGSSAAIPFINVANVANAVSGILTNGFSVGSASETNTSGTNNYRWVAWRIAATITITGNIYQSNESSLDTTVYGVYVSVNNATPTAATVPGDGTYTFSNITVGSNYSVVVYIYNNTNNANAFTVSDGATNITGLNLIVGKVTVGGTVANSDICYQSSYPTSSTPDDALLSCSGNNITAESGVEWHVLTSGSYSTGSSATLTTQGSGGDLHLDDSSTATFSSTGTISGNLTIDTGANLVNSSTTTLNVAGNWSNSGTFTANTGTVNLTGADSSTQTISGSTTFNDLAISTASNSAGRTVTFTAGTTQTVAGTWTVTGYSGKIVTLNSSTTSAWTVNPTAASVTYVSVSYSTNSGISFCATFSTNGGNNLGWNIVTNSSCPAPGSTQYSFQRKTWYDGTRYWRSYADGSNIQFWYSTDGSSWTHNSSADITATTSDFSVQADSSNGYVAYTRSAVTNEDNLLTDSALKAYWKMNEASWNGTSNEVVDSSGNAHHGTAQGNATTTSSGQFNNSGTFDGTGDYVTVADHADLDITGDFTLSAWVARSGGSNEYVISKTNDSADGGYALLIGSSGEVYCRTNNGVSSTDSYTLTGYVNADSTWHHLSAVRSGTSCRVYVDGIDRTNTVNTHTTLTANSNNLTIGSQPNGASNFTQGKIDDARVYNRALTAAEIQNLAYPGYDIEVRKATGYPGTAFSWGNEYLAYNGSSTTDYYSYPTIAQDSTGKLWINSTYTGSGSISARQVATGSDDGVDVAGSGTFRTANNPDNTWTACAGGVNTNCLVVGGKDGSGNVMTTGIRFQNITVPKGAVITSASFDLKNQFSGNYGTNVKDTVKGALTSNISTFSDSNLPRSQSTTTASASWNSASEAIATDTWYSATTSNQPPAITSIVQEIVNQSTWTSGNSLGLIITDNGSTTDWWYEPYAYESGAANSAKLTINYSTVNIFSVQSTSANDITAWNTNSSLNASTNTNQYGVIVPRTSGAMQAIWTDGTTIESKNYNGSAWDSSPTSIATGVSGVANNLSATSDGSGNVHLSYIDSSNHTVYREYTSSWQTAVTLDSNSGNSYTSISFDSSDNSLYTFWVRGSHVYYKHGVSDYTSGNWDTNATDWHNDINITSLSSNFSGSGKIFAEWNSGSSAPYNVNWDIIAVPEHLMAILSLGIFIPFKLRRKKQASDNKMHKSVKKYKLNS